MAKAWDRAPGCDLPGVFPQRGPRKAAYRLLANPRVSMDDILHPHREAVVERCALETTVLLVQDTTTLNYSGLGHCTSGLGPLGGQSKGQDGLLVHAGLALADGGRALGVFRLRPWARLKPVEALGGGREKESVRWLEGFEQAVELGRACPSTRVITVCDREGDIYALFRRQAERPEAAGLLVRANRARQRRVPAARKVQPLWAHLQARQPVVSDRIVRIAARGGKHARKRRKARTEVRVAAVQLRAPKGRGAPVAAQAVLVSEPQPPKGRQPLNWLLLSSDGEATAADALRTVARYERRWLIEEYFRVLKCGTKLLDRRLREAASIENCLVFEAVNAWKEFDITRLARERPQDPAGESFSAVGRRVLNTLLNSERILPAALRNQPPPSDIRTTVVNLARVAGFRPTKRQTLPGDTVVWKAWQIIKPMIRWEEARIAAENADNPESTVS